MLAEQLPIEQGSIEWGSTIAKEYYPKDNTQFFEDNINILNGLVRIHTLQMISL